MKDIQIAIKNIKFIFSCLQGNENTLRYLWNYILYSYVNNVINYYILCIIFRRSIAYNFTVYSASDEVQRVKEDVTLTVTVSIYKSKENKINYFLNPLQ